VPHLEDVAQLADEQDENSKSSDEYEVLERNLIHPMTIMSQVSSTLKMLNT
jgi:hypothetical protein